MGTFFIALFALLIGSIMMHLIDVFKQKKKETEIKEEKRKLICESFLFKADGFRIFKNEMTDKTCEFWALKDSMRKSFYEDKYFLGSWIHDEYVPPKDMPELPWAMRKCTMRIQRLMRGLPQSHQTW